MEYRRLGNTGLPVSRICLGCMSYGDPATPSDLTLQIAIVGCPDCLGGAEGLSHPKVVASTELIW